MRAIGEFDREIPRLVPKPEPCEMMRANVQCLDGIWEFCHKNGVSEEWNSTEVPSYIGKYADESEGFTGIYSYRRKLSFLGCQDESRKLLKLEGVNGYAKLYVDGNCLAEHWNGFLTWNVDITEACRGKTEVTLQIDVDETGDRVGCFYHGGILHSIWLYLLPQTYISMVQISTELDQNYENAVLTVDYSVEADAEANRLELYEIEGFLTDPSGMRIEEAHFCELVTKGSEDRRIERRITQPLLWDAEHPYLYTMWLRVCRDGEVIETVQKKFGFRQIERRENQVYVNGREIKLHGVCRHEITPRHGRWLTKEWIDRDVQLFKEANCNYIRTSHYSPSEYFLEACDREGIYVEDELGLAFVAKTSPYTQRDPKETQRFLSHFQEAMARDYSHPCVLIWSLCNESFGGYNFDVLNRYIHRKDPTRMTKFSYPMTMQLEHEPVDVWSIHYSNQDVDLSAKRDNVSVGIMDGKDVPVIHDEYAHIPCYNREEHRRDPNVRNFWGESIRRFWDKIWNTKGALGGAIWAGIDETDTFTGGETRLEWGIIDIWRRRKPEFYLVRKAYSPIVIKGKTVKREIDGTISIEVENRFCHTDLSEAVILWKAGGRQGSVRGPRIPAGKKGLLRLQAIPAGENLELIWYDAFGKSVDEYSLEMISANPQSIEKENERWEVLRESGKISLIRGDARLVFDEQTARICEGTSRGEKILADGPDINLSGICLGAWQKEYLEILSKEESREEHQEERQEESQEEPEIISSGWYGDQVKVTFRMRFQNSGEIKVAYRIDQMNVSMPDRIKLRVSVSCGGLNEIGVGFTCVSGMDTLSWKRDGQWSVYPDDHIARNEGTAFRFSRGSVEGREPQIPWKDEMRSYILNGKYDVDYRGTNDFRSQKENIRRAELFRAAGKGSIAAVSDGNDSVRAEVQEPKELLIGCEDERVRYTGEWSLQEDPAAGAAYREMWAKKPGSAAEVTFEGTGIVWYGPVDVVYGYARVYVDGELMDDRVLQRVNGVDFPGSADGYDKKYHYPVYSIDRLEPGTHTIRIEPAGLGSEESQDTYIVIAQFRVLDGTCPEPVQFWVNNACNYPMISWGNYCRPPILVGEGYENHVTICLDGRNRTDK